MEVKDLFQPQNQEVATTDKMLRQYVTWTTRLSPTKVLYDALDFLGGESVMS